MGKVYPVDQLLLETQWLLLETQTPGTEEVVQLLRALTELEEVWFPAPTCLAHKHL